MYVKFVQSMLAICLHHNFKKIHAFSQQSHTFIDSMCSKGPPNTYPIILKKSKYKVFEIFTFLQYTVNF